MVIVFLSGAMHLAEFNPTRAQNFTRSAGSAMYDGGRFPVDFSSFPWPGVARVRTPLASGQAEFVCPSVGIRLLYIGLELTALFTSLTLFQIKFILGGGCLKTSRGMQVCVPVRSALGGAPDQCL